MSPLLNNKNEIESRSVDRGLKRLLGWSSEEKGNGGSFFLEFLLTFGSMPKVSPAKRLKRMYPKESKSSETFEKNLTEEKSLSEAFKKESLQRKIFRLFLFFMKIDFLK